jgi:hypothetical protein
MKTIHIPLPPNTTDEVADIIMYFATMLLKPTGDGSKKLQRGEKPSWKVDRSHEAAIFSHLMKWKKGEKVDPDSGAHPLVHAAWRCLAIAWQEMNNMHGARRPAKPEPLGNHVDRSGLHQNDDFLTHLRDAENYVADPRSRKTCGIAACTNPDHLIK